jgi:hypothetical protein
MRLHESGLGARRDEVDRVSLATRQPKQHARIDELRTTWWERAEAAGLGADDLAACLHHPAQSAAPDPEEIHAQLAAPDGICENLSIFTYGDLLAALVDLPVPQPDGGDPQPLILAADELEELAHGFLRSAHVTEIKPHADLHQRQFTVAELHQAQERIMGRYTDGLRDQAAVVPADTLDEALVRNSHLTDEQQALVRTFCTSGQRIQCAIGRAGAGKTTAMRTAVEAWQGADFKVVGAAVKGEAARILGDSTGLTTETLAWWLAHADPAKLAWAKRYREQYPAVRDPTKGPEKVVRTGQSEIVDYRPGASGTIECRIEADGQVIAGAESSGADAIVTCEGVVP